MKKNFIKKNEEFKCENCGKFNEKHKSSCRNHCKYCLRSKHVDKDIPGDRKSACKSLMEPIDIEVSGKKGYIIIHKCLKCGKVIKNMMAPDDDFDAIIALSSKKIL